MILYYSFEEECFEYEVCTIEALKALGLDVEEDEEEYRDEITDYYYNEAYEAWKDQKEYERNPLGYFGMSEKDFL